MPVGPGRNNDRMIRWVLGVAAVLFMCLLGLLFVGYLVLQLGVGAVLGGMVLATLPVPLYVALALWIDRFEKEPIWMLAGAFLWGATVAVFFSLIFNTINSSIVGSTLGGSAGQVFGPVFSAPLVEESAKGLALLILFFWKKDEFDDVIDGIVYAAMVGLGFAMGENILYYGRELLAGGIVGSLSLFVLRGMLAPFSHPLFTSMTGIGLGLARQSNRGWVKIVAPVLGFLGAMFLHFLWNLSGTIGGNAGFFGTYFLFMVPTFIGLLVFVGFALRREGRIVRTYLTPELQSGLLTREDYELLGSVRGRLVTSFRSLQGGIANWHARSRFGQAATELAFLRERVARGITSPRDPEREAAYVRIMRDLGRRPGSGHEQAARAE